MESILNCCASATEMLLNPNVSDIQKGLILRRMEDILRNELIGIKLNPKITHRLYQTFHRAFDSPSTSDEDQIAIAYHISVISTYLKQALG